MKKLVLGIMAHVDAGKTTLSESMLYLSGAIRKMGRVDNRDAYLDTYELERTRGITIFSKQAIFNIEDTRITLLDTPGHIDFSAEMERTLQVLDYAVLVISGADGVQAHTKTLWHLLSLYHVPVFIFVNKMDQNRTGKEFLLSELRGLLDDGCIEFIQKDMEYFYEELAMCGEEMLHEFLHSGEIKKTEIVNAIKERKVFPVYFGSALKLDGVQDLLQGIVSYASDPVYPDQFSARIFKIARDEQGSRFTYLKVTGGSLKVRTALTNRILEEEGNSGHNAEKIWEDKVTQIRLYSGEKYEVVEEAEAGSICAVTGLTNSRPWERLGAEAASDTPVLEPILSYQIKLGEFESNREMLPKLRLIEEEEPELHIIWDENLEKIQIQVMGEVQMEILKSLVLERFGVTIDFELSGIIYKETIANVAEGIGHFEPLRHYAEVHLLLEPLERGSGLMFDTKLSEDHLSRNWQRQIITYLEEKTHKGVLTGSSITDMKITLVAGRAHKKHTEGGDFREATYRAVRQGLKQAEVILLEPYYDFQIEIPEKMVGRAMVDIENMHGSCEISGNSNEMVRLEGKAPVASMKNYAMNITSYTKGEGRIFCSIRGYEPCHNTDEVVERLCYDSERDLENPCGSVFCSHGAGFLVDWDKVKEYMHIESYFQKKTDEIELQADDNVLALSDNLWMDTEEIDRIIARTFYANQGDKSNWRKTKSMKRDLGSAATVQSKRKESKGEYLLVDGYNIVFAWPELKELAQINMDAARGKLMDLLCSYQTIRRCHLIVVFDAYRISGHATEILEYNTIHVVYTKEAETADRYIEKFVHDLDKNYSVTVATSDGLEQIIIRGQGCSLLSARDLKEEMNRAFDATMKAYEEQKQEQKTYLFDSVSESIEIQIEKMRLEEE